MRKELVTLPGLVDPHVHLREPGATHKEDFETGTMAAIAGGYTTIIDMPNNPEPTVSSTELLRKITLAESRIYCDVGFHFGATAQSSKYFELVKDQVFGLKVYMSHTHGPLLVDDPSDLETIFSTWPKSRPILVHAEGGTLHTAINLAEKHQQKLHVCHLATEEELLMVKKAKEKGLPVTCEATCHHLFLTEEDTKNKGAFAIMRPSLATHGDQQALWSNLDVIDMIASDHAPHTKEEKLNSERPPYGVPGLETTLPLMLTAVAEGRLSLARLIELTSTNPRRIFGISEAPDTYTEVDLSHSYIISSEHLKTKSGWTPFEGMRVTGRVAKVVLRGVVVFDGENIQQSPMGQVIYPKAQP
jgi:dihydroorotase-like cyclic amidohydrolase